MRNSVLVLLSLLMASTVALGSTVAIIDSGTDVYHVDLVHQIWTNKFEIKNNNVDEDKNGYIDDFYGWNFAENNNKVIDMSYVDRLTFDIRKFFEIQTKTILGTASDEEVAWIKERRTDEKFVKELSVYGNFMHGTHVSGIAAKDSADAKILAIKLIPTEVKLPFRADMKDGEGLGFTLLKFGLGQLAAQQMKTLETIAKYANGHKADVANGSFGTGYPQAKMISDTLFKALMKRDPTMAESKELANHFLNSLVREGDHMVKAAANTLFVFAAGNDGLDNDKFGSSPANIRAENVISVAATIGDSALAPFSNYGIANVDVAAPGVNIESTVPGNEYLVVNGTSQAAPYISNVAAQIKDANKDLTPGLVKEILLKTVDKRSYLAGKVKSGGIANMKRAVLAAELSNRMPIAAAVAQAVRDVVDAGEGKFFDAEARYQGNFVLPLPTGFSL